MSSFDPLSALLPTAAKRAARRWLYTTPAPIPPRWRITGALSRAHEKFALVAPDLTWLYVQTPKAASSTIKRQLWRLYGQEVADDAAMRLHRERGVLKVLPDLTGAEVRRVLEDEQTFRFTFVRNPYDRLVSAYKDKVLNASNLHPGGYDLGLAVPSGPPAFDTFVRAIAETDDELCNVHWMSQHRCGLFDIVRFHKVGKVETYEADMDEILARIAGPSAPKVKPINSSRALAGEEAAGIGFTQELAALAHQRYRRDFEQFGYDPMSYPRPATP